MAWVSEHKEKAMDNVDVGVIWPPLKRNPSRVVRFARDDKGSDFAAKSKTALALLGGWSTDQGIAKIRRKPSKELLAEVQAELEAEYEKAKAGQVDLGTLTIDGKKVTIDPLEYLKAFRTVYCNGNDKLRTIKHVVVTGNCRVACLPLVNAIRQQMGADPILKIPVILGDWEEEECMLLNLAENTGKHVGEQHRSDADKAYSARQLFEAAVSEADFGMPTPKHQNRAGYNRGWQQRLYALAYIDATFPEMGIIDRIIKTNDKVPQNTNNKMVTFKKACQALEEIPKDQQKEARTLLCEDIKAYFYGAKKPNPKGMPRKDQDTIVKQSPVDVAKFIVQGIMDNDKTHIASLNAKKAAHNAAFKAIQACPVARIDELAEQFDKLYEQFAG